jgi:glutaredoxin 3
MLTVYSKNFCPYCDQAKALLKKKEIPFTVVNIEENAEAKAFVLSEGHRTVPQIYEGDKLYVEGGFTGLQAKLKEIHAS